MSPWWLRAPGEESDEPETARERKEKKDGSVYIVVSTDVAARVDPLAMSTVVIASAAVPFAALALARGPSFPASAAGGAAVAAGVAAPPRLRVSVKPRAVPPG